MPNKQNQNKPSQPQPQPKPNPGALLDQLEESQSAERKHSSKDLLRFAIATSAISSAFDRFNLSGQVVRKKIVARAAIKDAMDMLEILDELVPDND